MNEPLIENKKEKTEDGFIVYHQWDIIDALRGLRKDLMKHPYYENIINEQNVLMGLIDKWFPAFKKVSDNKTR